MKIEDDVGRSQSVSDNQTVMSRDDAEFKIKGKIARHSQTRSHTTTITESRDSKRDVFSRSAAALAPVEPFGKTETNLDCVLKHASAEIIERHLQTKALVVAWRSPFTTPAS